MAHRSAPTWDRAVVRGTVPVADGIRHILLDVPGNPHAAPGTRIDVLVPAADGTRLVRSYSVVDDSRTPDVCGIAVRRDPRSRGGSAYMHALRPGDEITVSQPVQDFELTPGRPGYVLLGGGIGITPLIGMAHALKHRGADYRLVYTGRTRSAMAFVDELRADHDDRLDVVVDDESGMLDCGKLVAGLPADVELYVCGPPGMRAAVQEQWQQAGRLPGLLRFETFGSGGTLPTLPFTIRVPRTGLRVSVPADQSALQTVEAAGGEVMSDCLRQPSGPSRASGSGRWSW